MIEIAESGADLIRLLNVDAIAEVAPSGTKQTEILMRDGRTHRLNMPYTAFRARLGLLLNRMLPLDASL